ncbi:MAG: hypothetical protein D6719_03065 [Candidatus Dadabacteria bacterium]|nr:MAG: hypothetical protein D6719_03065 [Candidatus Dadabacteria bacterium]
MKLLEGNNGPCKDLLLISLILPLRSNFFPREASGARIDAALLLYVTIYWPGTTSGDLDNCWAKEVVENKSPKMTRANPTLK